MKGAHSSVCLRWIVATNKAAGCRWLPGFRAKSEDSPNNSPSAHVRRVPFAALLKSPLRNRHLQRSLQKKVLSGGFKRPGSSQTGPAFSEPRDDTARTAWLDVTGYAVEHPGETVTFVLIKEKKYPDDDFRHHTATFATREATQDAHRPALELWR